MLLPTELLAGYAAAELRHWILHSPRHRASVSRVGDEIALLVHDLVRREHFTHIPHRVPVTIGRDPAWAACVLADAKVSRMHASVDRRQDRLFVRDEASRNGTWVDGKRLPSGIWIGVGSVSRLHEMRIGGWAILFSAAIIIQGAMEPRSGERSRHGRSSVTPRP